MSGSTLAWQRRHTIASAVLFAGTALTLTSMGRRLWCKCGSLSPWSWDIWTEHNSQHLLDPYLFSHVLHGVVFFGLLALVAKSRSLADRLVIAGLLEAAWEVLENTPMVVNKYREATISLDYFGDSVANSMVDIVACMAGFLVAASIPAWASVGGFVAVELALAMWIRDSLILNVIMLIYPLESIKTWQMGGMPTP